MNAVPPFITGWNYPLPRLGISYKYGPSRGEKHVFRLYFNAKKFGLLLEKGKEKD